MQKVGPSFFTVTSRPDYVAEQHTAGLGVAVYDVATAARVDEAAALHVDYVIRDRPNA